MKRFIAVFLVLSLFFNMNSVALAGIIEDIVNTPHGNGVGSFEINSGGSTGEVNSGDGIQETEDSNLTKTFIDIIRGLGNKLNVLFKPIVEFIPSFELFIFGRELGNIDSDTATSPLQLTFFTSGASGLAGSIQSITASIYNALRYLVTAFYIIILVYLAVRILLSSVGRQKAHYKSLLQYWVMGLLLLFSFHWVMAFIIWFSDTFTQIFASIASSGLGENGLTSGTTLASYLAVTLPVNSGTAVIPLVGIILQLFIFIAVIVATALIGFIYIKRLLFVALLIIVFPLVVLSYVFDKIGDRKSQTFNTWLKEFITNVCVQPIHALLLSFIIILISQGSIFNWPVLGPILALILIYLIPSGEDFLKKLFQLSSSMGVGGGISHSLAHQGMALHHMKQMAQPFLSAASRTMAVGKILKQNDINNKPLKERLTNAKKELKDNLTGFDGIKGPKATLAGTAKNMGGLYQAARTAVGTKGKRLEQLQKANDSRYAKIQEQIKAKTKMDSYADVFKANVSDTVGAYVGAAVGTGAFVAGEGAKSVVFANMAAKAIGGGISWATNRITAGSEYNDLAQKIETNGIQSLSDSERATLKKMYGDEIPSEREIIEDLKFKRRVAKYGENGDADLARLSLPSQRKNREAVFGEGGIYDSPDKLDKSKMDIDKKNISINGPDGKKTLLGEGISDLRYSYKNLAAGGWTPDEQNDIAIEQTKRILQEKGVKDDDKNYAKLFSDTKLKVNEDLTLINSRISEYSHQPSLMKHADAKTMISHEIPAAQKISSIADFHSKAMMNPESINMTAQQVNDIVNDLNATATNMANKDYIQQHMSEMRKAFVSAGNIDAFNDIMIRNGLDIITGSPLHGSTPNYATALNELHAVNSSFRSAITTDDLLTKTATQLEITNDTYSTIQSQIVDKAQSAQNETYARNIVENMTNAMNTGNYTEYGITKSQRTNVLTACNIDPITLRPIDTAKPQQWSAAAETFADYQKMTATTATTLKAAESMKQLAIGTERMQMPLSNDQLQVLKNAGGPFEIIETSDRTLIRSAMNPENQVVIEQQNSNIPEGVEQIRAGIFDPADPNNEVIIQSSNAVDRRRLELSSSESENPYRSGTVYDLSGITDIPTGQFTLVRAGDYCIIQDENGKIYHAQRGLEVTSEPHAVILAQQNVEGVNKYVVQPNENNQEISGISAQIKQSLNNASIMENAYARFTTATDEQKKRAGLIKSLVDDLLKR